MLDARCLRRSGVDEVCPELAAAREQASTCGGTNVERNELGVRVLDRRAAALPVVHERLRVHEAGVEMERGAVTRA